MFIICSFIIHHLSFIIYHYYLSFIIYHEDVLFVVFDHGVGRRDLRLARLGERHRRHSVVAQPPGFGVEGLGFGVWGVGCRVWGLRSRAWGLFRVWGFGFWFLGLGLRF